LEQKPKVKYKKRKFIQTKKSRKWPKPHFRLRKRKRISVGF